MSTEIKKKVISKEPDSNLKNCIGCHQSIHSLAKICPHCGTKQASKQWLNLDKLLKYIGAITAISSLVFGSHQLYTLVQQSQDKSIIAAQLVRAAKVQFKANDFEAGHKLLKQAVQVSPGSKEAMKLLVQMGVDTLQGIYPIWGSGYGNGLIRVSYDDSGAETYYFLTDREDILTFLDEIQIDSLLSRAVVESSGEQRAKLLAHLAWLKLAKNTSDSTIDVEILFEDAIKAEEKNVYANTMIAAWFLSPYYQGKYEEDKMVLQSKAYEHFKVALQQTSNNKKLPHEKYYPRAWIRSIQRACLNGVDELKIVDEMWENGEPIVSTLGVTRGTFIALSGRGGAPYQGVVPELEKELISRFDTDHLLKLASWLAEKEYGCGSDGTCFKDAGHEASQMLYAIGRIYELSGDIENAHKMYLKAQSQQYDKLGWWTDFIENGLERTRQEL